MHIVHLNTHAYAHDIEAIIKKCAKLLPWWVREVYVAYQPMEQYAGECYPSRKYRRINLTFNLASITSKNELVDLVIHEMSHSLNEPLIEIMGENLEHFIEDDSLRVLFKKLVDRRIEEQTEDLTHVFKEILYK